VKAMARAQGISAAEIIRRAIDSARDLHVVDMTGYCDIYMTIYWRC
jgi:hypothetical protein